MASQQPSNDGGKPKKERTSMCPYCGMTFNKKEHLQRHERTHTLDRPYQCDYDGCGKSFARRDTLTRHTRLHQRDELQGGPRSTAADHGDDEDEAIGSALTTPMGSKQVSPDDDAPVSSAKGKKQTPAVAHSRTSSAGSAQRGPRRGSGIAKAQHTTSAKKAQQQESKLAKSEDAPGAAARSSRPRRSAAIATTSYDETAIMDTDSPSDAEMDEDSVETTTTVRMDAIQDTKPNVVGGQKGTNGTQVQIQTLPAAVPPINNFATWEQAQKKQQQELASPSSQTAALMIQHAAANGNPTLLGYSSSNNSSGSSSGSTYNSSQLTGSVAGSQASPYSFSTSPSAGGMSALGLDLGLPASPAVPILPTPDGNQSFQGFNFALPSSSAGPTDERQQHYRHPQPQLSLSIPHHEQQQFQHQHPHRGALAESFPIFQSPPSATIDTLHHQHHHSDSNGGRPTTQAAALAMASLSNAPAVPAFGNSGVHLQQQQQQQQHEPDGVFFNPFAYHHFQHPYSPELHARQQQQQLHGHGHARNPSIASSTGAGPSPSFPAGSQGYPNQSKSAASQSFLASSACRSPDATQFSQCGPALRPAVASAAAHQQHGFATIQNESDNSGTHMNKSGRMAPHFETKYFAQLATQFQQQQQQQPPQVTAASQMHQRLQQLPQHNFFLDQPHQRALSRSLSPTDDFEMLSGRSSDGSPLSGTSFLSASPTLAAAPALPYSTGSPASDATTLPSLSSSFSSAFSGDFFDHASAPRADAVIIPVKPDNNLTATAFKYKNSCMQPLTIVDPSAAAIRGGSDAMNAMLRAADAHTDQFINWPESQPSPLSFSGFSPEHTYSVSSVNTSDSPSAASYLDLNDYDASHGSLFGEKTFTTNSMTIPHEVQSAKLPLQNDPKGRQSPIASLEDWLNTQISGHDHLYQ